MLGNTIISRITAIFSALSLFFSLLGGQIPGNVSDNPLFAGANYNPYITRPLTDITLNGKAMGGSFSISTPDKTEGTVFGDAAQTLCDGLYRAAGIRLKITDTNTAGGFIIKQAEPGFAANRFSLTVTNGAVTILGGSAAGISRGITAFINEVLFNSQGIFDFKDGYEFNKTYTDYTTYEDFGAVGDGKTDDIQAIIETHEYANSNGLSVLAREGAQYYIGGGREGAKIKTNTDWSTARFIIDDTEVDSRSSYVFSVSPSARSVSLKGVSSLSKDSDNLGITLEQDSVVVLVNSNVKRYIRYGANQNEGSDQTDVVLADKDGNISPDTPLLWDFDEITRIKAYPIDAVPITIKGGIFTTIANAAPSEYDYYNRGLLIDRSNTTVDGLVHRVVGEGMTGAPYNGFIIISHCAHINIKNCTFTGHKTYLTIGSAGLPVTMGSYDLNVSTAMNVTFSNCTQTNDITDIRYWGISGSNYCKNLVYDGCTFSRFDAHMGVANATIKNSVLGYQGINLIGSGTALIENSTIKSINFINLRDDYGSTWQGNMIIRNCKHEPPISGGVIINGSNNGSHDFGYTCYLPQNIEIDGLKIRSLGKPRLFSIMNINYTSRSYVADYPMVLPERITVRNCSSLTSQKIVVSANKNMFADVTVEY